MKFDITTKYEDGSIAFEGTANAKEASFILNIGVNYLLSNGAMPLLTGKTDEELAVVAHPESEQVQ